MSILGGHGKIWDRTYCIFGPTHDTACFVTLWVGVLRGLSRPSNLLGG